MAKESDYAALVVQAEQAVKAVKDPELKRVAFEKILDDLLAEGSSAAPSRSPAKAASKKVAVNPARRKARGPSGYLTQMLQ